MSGGTDSSVAALLLKDQNYTIEGITFRSYDSISKGCMERENGCCNVDTLFEAKQLATSLGFPHRIIDSRQDFKDTVIKDFINEYLKGRTPNPCVVCNTTIKWGSIADIARKENFDYIATGHYAQIGKLNGRYFLKKGIDEIKDQTYFLWTMTQDNLKHTLFPLGHLVKDEVREIARKNGYEKIANKRESQEICFVTDNDYRRFLRDNIENVDDKIKPGNFLDREGKVIGTHKGYPFYTIGQRKGLNIALGHPAYVTKLNPENNTVTLGQREELNAREMWVEDLNMMKYATIEGEMELLCKVRYNNKGILSRVSQYGNRLKVEFYTDAWAITPGQSAVFYEGDDVVCGGLIM